MEKDALEQLLQDLAVVQEQEDKLKEENYLAEKAIRDAELAKIREHLAAKSIQRSWRAYKTRMLLKSKKKKRRRGQKERK